ncbi:unnamed protein product [Boreogadus saida]
MMKPFLPAPSCIWVGVALCLATPTLAFSHGAGHASCQGMRPGHIRAQPQEQQHSHVILRTSASSYLPGQLVTVTVRSSRDFMGFLLQARGAGGPEGGSRLGMSGSWSLTPPGTHTLGCFSPGDSLTHSDKQLKRNLSFVWRAPDHPLGDIQFYITVVQSYFIYWAGIKSPVVHDGNRSFQNSSDTISSNRSRPLSELLEEEHPVPVFRAKTKTSNLTGSEMDSPPAAAGAPQTDQKADSYRGSAQGITIDSNDPQLLSVMAEQPGRPSTASGADIQPPDITGTGSQQTPLNSKPVGSDTPHEPAPAPLRLLPHPLNSVLTPSSPLNPDQRLPIQTQAFNSQNPLLPDSGENPSETRLGPESLPDPDLNPRPDPLKPKPSAPEKEGKTPSTKPGNRTWELGMLLGSWAGLGLALVVAVRCVYQHWCGKQTELRLNAREREYERGERGLIHVQECGDLVRVRRIRENSFVLLAEYDVRTPAEH